METVEGQPLLEILRAVEAFEDGWHRGEPIRLEELLAPWRGPARRELFAQALGIELHYRRRRGERPTPDEYEGRFPDLAAAVQSEFGEGPRTVTHSAGSDEGTERDSSDLSASASPGPGPRRIGKYEVIRILGGGGQGSALLARDPDLGRRVVLKRYHAGRGDAPAEIEEGRALARVISPYVARCHGIERIDGEVYLVVEYIPGRSLEEARRAGALDLGRTVEVIARLAEGVAAVHARGLIHRDIKPANVILHDDGTPRLVDFGLAAHLGSDRLRELGGSPPYMAPEQARCDSDRIDHRTDVFGLGALLYKMLAGMAPHSGSTAAEILRGATRGETIPLRQLAPEVPPAVEAACMKALAPAPENRQSTALEFAADLRRAIAHGAEAPRRPSRRPLAATAALLAGLAVAALVWARPGTPTAATPPGDAPPAPATAPEPAAGTLRAEIGVEHFKELGDARHVERSGTISRASLPASPPRLRDLVRVHVTLSRPAYGRLIALNPDGTVQPCLPAREVPADAPRTSLDFPEDPRDYFGLTDGVGLQAFVFVASDRPLPAFDAWKARVPGDLAWSPVHYEGFWAYDEAVPSAAGPGTRTLRGDILRRESAPEALVGLCDRIRRAEGVTLVRAVAFPVEPADTVAK
ncbi:Serine/threonine-protein kinase PrkC [Aquisphaera giovannonii]|uniref:Serine/threonine-protein kinase PrkC n=1 Tax=Aquisphaera giovannonii TaxID=406548 RepID=A0A5B9W305_9BACT|nr:serine/threonine protein kinase [Aquisphaera giovannonii]QEH34996.1 Serine/threonine-protein kinase PrkC [Aquisphaera giovannonii]